MTGREGTKLEGRCVKKSRSNLESRVGVRSGAGSRLTPSKGKRVIFVTKQNSILSNRAFDVKFQQDREKVTGIIPGERREPERHGALDSRERQPRESKRSKRNRWSEGGE